MEQQTSAGSLGLKKDGTNVQSDLGNQDSKGAVAQQLAHTNGASHEQNGRHANGTPMSPSNMHMSNGDHSHSGSTADAPSVPPQLDDSWRHGPSNKSMGKLIDRLTQQTYHDLNDTLAKMSEIPQQQDAPQTNGLIPNQQDTSQASLKKKEILMTFLNDTRDRFTKMAVLSDWARNNANEMAQLITVKVWQDAQRAAHANAAYSIGEMKRKMIDFKVPAPNIEGAMELLATGKASWIPDLGYIPPKRLSPQQLLKTLKDMNFALATRLNLHEDLPPHMQAFQIADGRATFHVPGEFQVDIAVADEDTTSPFYFIDLRFDFSPSPADLHDQLRAHLEPRINASLAKDGLKGCYDFLHNFILTHKISVLAEQARQLARYGKWVDCIKPEYLRRTLVVQYWATLPGPKNWFEIGIESGRPKRGSRAGPSPKLSVRWFRRGSEVKDEQLEFDWGTLDFEACLLQVLGKHCSGKLGAAENVLKALSALSSDLKTTLTIGSGASQGARLNIELSGMRTPLTVQLEQTTGQLIISPPSAVTRMCERTLNADANVDVSKVLASCACQAVQEQVRKQAEMLDWQEFRSSANSRGVFGPDSWQRSVFLLPGWGQNWAVAVSFGLGGQSWFVVQVTAPHADERGRQVRDIKSASPISCELKTTDGSSQVAGYTRAMLLQLERSGMAEVSRKVFSQDLNALSIEHDFEKKPASLTGAASSSTIRSSEPAFLHFSSLMRPIDDKKWKRWAADIVRLFNHGIEGSETLAAGEVGNVRHDVRLSLEPGKLKRLRQTLTRSRETGIAFNGTGGLAMQLRTPFGESFLERLRKRLQSVERLDRYVTVLQRLGFHCTTVTLDRLAFTYSEVFSLSAQLTSAADGNGPVHLKLEPTDSNPHCRVRVSLEQLLNSKDANAFENFAHILPLTLPFLKTVERLEATHASKRSLVVRTRSSTWYTIAYKAPLPACTFDLRARGRQNGNTTSVKWHLAEAKTAGLTKPEGWKEAIDKFWHQKGERWFGLGDSLIADSQGIEAALKDLDGLVQTFESAADNPPEEAAPTSTSGPTTAPPPPAASDANKPQPAKPNQQPSQAPAKPASSDHPSGPKQAAAHNEGQGQRNDVIELD
ncbi:MED14-domain-containing protein [Hortaea werneckii]|nr:MED14-domain-containing protein [Hortaea werneckii]